MGAEDMRQRRKRPKWIEDVAMLGVGILVYLVAFPAAIYMHENAPQWETLAVFVSLGLGLLPVIWYWRFRRYGRFVAIIAEFFLIFSFTAAFFQGWEIVALALFNVAVILLAVAMFVWTARLTKRFESAMRAAGEELNGDPLFQRDMLFRDDGQRITVYPRRRRLILMCILQAAILTGIACVFAFLRPYDFRMWIVWIGSGLFACILILAFVATLYRLVIRKPALVVGPDGILDDGSFLWSGVGLIRWDEILAVYPTTLSSSGVKQHYLVILVTDFRAIRRRLPLLKRVALRNTYSRMSHILIMQLMLETPVYDLAQQIAHYVEGHAPPGWHEGAKADEASKSEDK